MGKYSKSYSNYVLRKRHQVTTDGSIFERDWGTLGERHVIESGKRKIYADSNFLFTDNNLRGTKKKNNTGEWSEPFTEENIDNTINLNPVNDISVLSKSNDIRDYAYFGSAIELIRSSIENIIKWFPGRVWSTSDGVVRPLGNGEFSFLDSIVTDGHHNYAATYVSYASILEEGNPLHMFMIKNPFEIDLHSTNAVLKDGDNFLRNMSASWKQYVVNGADITSWNCWSKPEDECDPNFKVIYDITFTYNKNCFSTRPIDDDECCITFADSNIDCITFSASDDCCFEEQSGHIYGLKYEDGIIWCTDIEGLVIQPKQVIIEDYFSKLNDFESLLLNRGTNPKYKSTFITPKEMGNNIPGYYYVEKEYIWPSIGYCICIDTISFDIYVSELYKLGSLFDELWCDNIWRNMTHEAIKNFDWTYTKDYIDGDEFDNIAGGTRMQAILRIIGREYDDIKRYIDAIGRKNKVTYDGYANIAPAELSDKCELKGWEIYSTKGDMNDNIELSSNFINKLSKLPNRWGNSAVRHENWFYGQNPNYINQNMVDNNFMSKLLLNSKAIFSSKGTIQSIEEVMALFGFGHNEFEFTERYYSVKPLKCNDIFYHYEIMHDALEIQNNKFVDLSTKHSTLEAYLKAINYRINAKSKSYIKIGVKYYKLIDYLTYEEFAENFNLNKNIPLNYSNDKYSGIPLKKVYINNNWYLVPYFTQDKIYDGDVQFETDGGWGKFIELSDNVMDKAKQQYDYLETLPYIDVLQNVSELTSVNPYTIGGKRAYYVIDLSDIGEYVETIPDKLSHFFKLIDVNNPQLFSSWKNIPTNDDNMDETQYDTYCNNNGLMTGVTYDDYKLCQYYDSLILDTLGNNPHVGYGLYDLGQKYVDYITTPFYYSANNYVYSDLDDCEIVKQFRFKVTEYEGDKVINRVTKEDEQDVYYLPSKLLSITNKLVMSSKSMKQFRAYFKNVILKYITQVIPSTTLFILKDF